MVGAGLPAVVVGDGMVAVVVVGEDVWSKVAVVALSTTDGGCESSVVEPVMAEETSLDGCILNVQHFLLIDVD